MARLIGLAITVLAVATWSPHYDWISLGALVVGLVMLFHPSDKVGGSYRGGGGRSRSVYTPPQRTYHSVVTGRDYASLEAKRYAEDLQTACAEAQRGERR